MKINNNNNNYQKYLNAIQQANQKKPTKNTKVEDQTPKANNQDKVEISADAKQLAEISMNEQREARVEEIKAAVQNGTYEVKPKEIANALAQTIQQQKGEN